MFSNYTALNSIDLLSMFWVLSLTEIFLLLAFLSVDFLIFFFFFEALTLPMLYFISAWGSRTLRIRAFFYFLVYTILSGTFLFFGTISFILLTDFLSLDLVDVTRTFSYALVSKDKVTLFLFPLICFFLSFSIKLPLVPFHVWLLEAHVEASAFGSVILASLLLKLGGYGFLRIFPLFYFITVSFYFWLFLVVVSVVLLGVILPILFAFSHNDLKRIIAYCSVSHMNIALLAFIAELSNSEVLGGAYFLMLSHGFVAAGLFLCIGFLYERTHTRNLADLHGILNEMPFCAFFFLFFLLGNCSFPLFYSFIAEILCFLSLVKAFPFFAFLGISTSFLVSLLSLWVFLRLYGGSVNTYQITFISDLTALEILTLLPLVLSLFFLGIFPQFFFI